MNVKIIEHFSGSWNWIMKQVARKEWLNLYNQEANVFNRHIDACNAAYNRKFGKTDLTNDANMRVYTKFVADYMNPLLSGIGSKFFKVDLDPNEAFFRMVDKKNNKNTFTFSMKEIK